MNEEWRVRGKERCVVINIHHLYPHKRRAVAVSCTGIVRLHLPHQIQQFYVNITQDQQVVCGLDDQRT